jgi:hypothetical protein
VISRARTFDPFPDVSVTRTSSLMLELLPKKRQAVMVIVPELVTRRGAPAVGGKARRSGPGLALVRFACTVQRRAAVERGSNLLERQRIGG